MANKKNNSSEDDEYLGYQKVDIYNQEKIDKLSVMYEKILKEIGEDPKREGLLKTPERVSKAMQF